MPLIPWKEDYSVNVKEIDKQHQQLIGFINTLHDAMKERKAEEVLGDILDGLINYSKVHFKTEEDYFDKFSYLGGIEQKRQHKAFAKIVSDLKADFEDGKPALSLEVMRFLKDWLINHIYKSDKKYSKCFNEHGLK